MAFRAFGLGVAFAVFGAGALPAQSPQPVAEEDTRNAAEFVKGLREKGYQDLAADYLERLREQPDAPAEITETVDYEVGRLLLDEASKTGDLVRRRGLLDQARTRLEAFSKANPKHALAPDALVQMARLLVERGHVAVLNADDTEVKADREAKLAEARVAFDQARVAYDSAISQIKAIYEKFPKFLDEKDPRKVDREKAHDALMQARLQRAIDDYEQGQTYALGTEDRKKLLSTAMTQFAELNKSYRTQFVGLTARMWEAKCYEEAGDIGQAIGIYKELLTHADPRLRTLQRHVSYFMIIAHGKRKEYALAADKAVQWLEEFKTPGGMRDRESLGVRFELAKDIIAQLPEIKGENDKTAAKKRIVESLENVVRYSSPFKNEAIDLLKTYKPKSAANALDIARLNYEDAVGMGESAVGSREWDRAALLYRQAIRRAEASRDVDKMVLARHHLAFCYYMNKHPYEAAVVADHIARNYPRAGIAPKSAGIAIAALAEAYDTFNQIDRAADLNNLVEMAKYTAEAFPETDEGDTARLLLGQVYQGKGSYEDALKAYASVRPKSPKRIDADTRAGGTHWQLGQSLRRAGKTAEADAEVATAVTTLEASLKARRETGDAADDPALIGNACELATVFLESNKAADAVKLLEPLEKQQAGRSGAAYVRLESTLLRSHIAASQVDLALTDMAAIEKAGESGANMTQLYFDLGKLLQKELEALKRKGDSGNLSRTQTAYLKFLTALGASKSGQTFESLVWAGDQMLTLGQPKDAEAVFRKAFDTYSKDQSFLARPGASSRLMLTKLKLSAAYRGEGRFSEAESLVAEVMKDNPKALDALFEKGLLLEDKAEAKQGTWNAAFLHWKSLAMKLGAARTKSAEYYDAWYHAALALNREGKAKEAKQTLGSIMRLSPKVGGPEMKTKYEKLLAQIK